MQSVENSSGTCFALDAPGGTGKTFRLTTLLAHIRSQKQIAIATAISGIAATLLSGGRTLHSTMKVPLDVDEFSTCGITPRDKFAADLRKCKLLVIDEVTMAHKYIYEALDRSLRDITGLDKLFGGITVLLSGDWRQILPVILRGGKVEIVDACLKKSHIWSSVQKVQLTQNMRLRGANSFNKTFADYLLKVGDGTVEKVDESDEDIAIPDFLKLDDNTIEGLCDFVYGDARWDDPTWLCERAILTPTNDLADTINDLMLGLLPSELREFKSADTVLEGTDNEHAFPPEFINSLRINGLPPHNLKLKPGCPVVLLRNLDPKNGHCNGSRYIVNQIYPNLLDVTVAYGANVGRRKLIPRIHTTSDDKLPFRIKRLQFPVRPSFSMTINKSQGQSFEKVGIYLEQDVFCHGQLYVALSRVRDAKNLKIATDESRKGLMKNIVYKEVL